MTSLATQDPGSVATHQVLQQFKKWCATGVVCNSPTNTTVVPGISFLQSGTKHVKRGLLDELLVFFLLYWAPSMSFFLIALFPGTSAAREGEKACAASWKTGCGRKEVGRRKEKEWRDDDIRGRRGNNERNALLLPMSGRTYWAPDCSNVLIRDCEPPTW